MDALVEHANKALPALRAFLAKPEASAKADEPSVEDLFAPPRTDATTSVDVEVSFLVAPVAHRVPLYVLVPHAVTRGSVCLITPPPQRLYKDRLAQLADDDKEVATRVRRVIDTKKLDAKVSTPVAARVFAKSYDNFVLYNVHKYPSQLTGEFLGHQKMPVWVPKGKSLEEALGNAERTVVVPRRGESNVTCCIGHTGMTDVQLAENLLKFVTTLTGHPQAAPLESILHIRVAGSNASGKRVSLPVYGRDFQLASAAQKRTAKAVTPGKRPREE